MWNQNFAASASLHSYSRLVGSKKRNTVDGDGTKDDSEREESEI